MNNKKLIGLIILFGAFLRLFWLAKYPSGFFRDEAALGYNAYSIWLTGKDEFGVLFPLVFRSFEVFFLPAYVYLSAPIVGILGLSEFSTRLLSSLSGIGSLITTYFIAKEIWNKKVAIISTFLLAISPWHIFYSRGAFEGNLALFFFSAGFLFWIRFLKDEKEKDFFVSLFSFVLSMYSYQAERMVVPLFGLLAISFSFRRIWKLKKKLIKPAIISFLLFIPLLSLSLKPGGYHRAFGVSIFSQEQHPPGWVSTKDEGLLINNRIFLRGKQVLALYTSYFSPRNLFIKGDANRQRSTENFSVFYTWLFPFMAFGMWQVVKRRLIQEKLFLSWVFLSPLPASFTGDPFHTYRSLLFYLPLTIFAGLGVYKVFRILKKSYKKLFLILVALASFGSLFSFGFDFFVITPATRARDWDYGYRQIVEFISKLPEGTKVVVDDPWTQGYIHFLFFGKKEPFLYQKQVANLGNPKNYYYTSPKRIRPDKIGNLWFRKIIWPKERGDKGTVFVMTAKDLPKSEFATDPHIKLLKEIKYPDGQVAYRIVKVI
jgi:4-amino-4-deoxy-L-arabinose transferase-like glycosyltransferase